ncbi:FAD-dependent oxidoreductase [Legionella clemsonensis]|uniref:3-hydroxybenzoate 6-hydroxylase 1 n=1 Tax=Legionella clemsonensis TaxID=1867846 RepID=A0A222P2H6_9GAMM|nr:NAD(P)/FAD-dependent oxidoreductase [Legionella clemsonensis]ASQ46039.1 3-hydroxybenzoate 6-hydroxylase 1 [Legionella clemsonensis]
MRILIVGAGIAGLTLAALLKQRGIKSEIIERQPDFAHSGYMLGLYPLGSKVLYGLGLMQNFLDSTTAGDTYVMCNGDGSVIQELAFHELFTHYGPYRCCSRKALIETLMKSCEGLAIKFNTTIQTLNQFNAKVHAILTDGTQGEYDLVVGADGMHSSVRKLILTAKDYKYYDTGWGGWVWWTDSETLNKNEIREFWGAGNFFGIYPTEEKFGVIAAGPTSEKEIKPYAGRTKEIIKQFPELHAQYPTIFSQLPADNEDSFFYWPLSDVRS